MNPLRPINKSRAKPSMLHIALLIRDYLKREKIIAKDLSRRLGISSSGGNAVNSWCHALAAPSIVYRAKLAALLEVDEDELLPKGQEGGRVTASRQGRDKVLVRLGPADALEAHLQAPLPQAQVLAPRRVPDVLSYTAAADGQAELRVLARGPHTRMAAVFRMLLDAGLVPGGEEEAVHDGQ